MSVATPAESGRRVLYLLTSDVSQVLVHGQLGFLLNRGWDVIVGVGDAGAASTAATWDDGVRVEFVPYVRQVSLLRDLRALWATIQLIRRVRPQLVNTSTPKAGLLGMLAARVCRVPVRVYVIRGLRLETVSGLQRRVLHTTERVAVGCSTHLLANSDSVLELARSVGIVPAEVGEVIGAGSGNGVDVDRFAPATARNAAVTATGSGSTTRWSLRSWVG